MQENEYATIGAFRKIPQYYKGVLDSYDYQCNKCRTTAKTKHEKRECNVCESWNGCRNDCTLSQLICEKCDIIQNV